MVVNGVDAVFMTGAPLPTRPLRKSPVMVEPEMAQWAPGHLLVFGGVAHRGTFRLSPGILRLAGQKSPNP